MYNVLIVEDEMLVRLGLKNSIDWAKHNMVVTGDVSNGKAALDFFMNNKPDIIITDLKMPLMNGMELIAKIRETDDKTRIVILSSLEEFDTVKKAISLGVSDYIAKLTMTEKEIDNILSKVRNELIVQARLNDKDSLVRTDIDVVKDRLLKDFMFYHIYSSEEFTNRIQALGLCLSPEHMILAIMEIDHYDSLKAYLEDDKGCLTNYALMNVISEILKRYVKGEVFYDEGPRYILVFNCGSICENDIRDEIASILENIKTH